MTRSQPDEDFLDLDGISQSDTPGTPITQSLNDDDLETPCDRPMGRKASKQAARDGGKRKSVGGQRSEAKWEAFMASQTNFVDGFKEVAKEKMAMLNRQHNELMESKRSEEEERLMLMDISKLDPTQQEWIKLKRRNLVNKLRMESDSSGC